MGREIKIVNRYDVYHLYARVGKWERATDIERLYVNGPDYVDNFIFHESTLYLLIVILLVKWEC